jgi:hypothetical protein
MAFGAVNGLLAKLADDGDLHDDLGQPQVQVVSALAVVTCCALHFRLCVHKQDCVWPMKQSRPKHTHQPTPTNQPARAEPR